MQRIGVNKSIALCCLLGALFLGFSSGAAFVWHNVAKGRGACEKLDGFPGLLQAAGFVPSGNCRLIDGKCPTTSSGACVVAGKPGHCVAELIDNKRLCVCVKDKMSR